MPVIHSVQTDPDLGITVASGISLESGLVSHLHYDGIKKIMTHILIGNNINKYSINSKKIQDIINKYGAIVESILYEAEVLNIKYSNVNIENTSNIINDIVKYFENFEGDLVLDNKCNTWDCLQKTGCAFINENNVNIPTKKLKKIALEEAIIWPTQTDDVDNNPPLEYYIETGEGYDKYNKLLDITGLRLDEMKENNIIYQVISFTAPGLQDLNYNADQVKTAQSINDYIYGKIKDYPNNFKAFATLPMQDPEKAALELERCVKKLGFVGALVNGSDVKYKGDGSKNNIQLFYDTPAYDILWAKFIELDVPFYMHPLVYPSVNTTIPDPLLQDFYTEYPELSDSTWGFSAYLAQHILRLVISGVFDRFPEFKLILGHMGEILPWWAERFDHRLCIYKNNLNKISDIKFKELGLPTFTIPKLTLTEYLQKNIYITTSGWFSNNALEYVIKIMGIDRVMFSIDYPYESQYLASDWIDNVPLSVEDKEKIAYKTAAKLLKLQID